MLGWGAGAISLLMAWVMRVSSLTLLVPLFLLPWALMLWAGAVLASLLAMLRIGHWCEEFGVHLINVFLAGVPLLYFVYLFTVYPGARTQFLLDFLLHPRI